VVAAKRIYEHEDYGGTSDGVQPVIGNDRVPPSDPHAIRPRSYGARVGRARFENELDVAIPPGRQIDPAIVPAGSSTSAQDLIEDHERFGVRSQAHREAHLASGQVSGCVHGNGEFQERFARESGLEPQRGGEVRRDGVLRFTFECDDALRSAPLIDELVRSWTARRHCKPKSYR